MTNQQRSGLRGDPVAENGQDDRSRDKSRVDPSSEGLRTLIAQWRKMAKHCEVYNHIQGDAEDVFKECASQLEVLLSTLETLEVPSGSPVIRSSGADEGEIHASIVRDLPGRPVAAPCAISGCYYGVSETLIERLQKRVEELEAHREHWAEVNELNHALTARLSTEGWQPIDTAPKDGTNILVFCPYRKMPVAATWQTAERYWVELYQGSVTPTHWMPLPAPPSPAPESPKG